jgi:hypothetical protein
LSYTPKDLPVITKKIQIKENSGLNVYVVGKYKEMNVNKNTTRKPLFIGRVYVELNDKSIVILETDKKGLRPKSEIKKYKNKKVVVMGTLYEHGTAWSNGKEESIVGPVIKNILFIGFNIQNKKNND